MKSVSYLLFGFAIALLTYEIFHQEKLKQSKALSKQDMLDMQRMTAEGGLPNT